MNSNEGSACSIEIIHRDDVLVIVGSRYWLVRKVIRVVYRVQFERARGVVAC